MEMGRLMQDAPVSRDQILGHVRGQGNIHFPCSADHEQDWQPYPVDPSFAPRDGHTYIHRTTTVVLSVVGFTLLSFFHINVRLRCYIHPSHTCPTTVYTVSYITLAEKYERIY